MCLKCSCLCSADKLVVGVGCVGLEEMLKKDLNELSTSKPLMLISERKSYTFKPNSAVLKLWSSSIFVLNVEEYSSQQQGIAVWHYVSLQACLQRGLWHFRPLLASSHLILNSFPLFLTVSELCHQLLESEQEPSQAQAGVWDLVFLSLSQTCATLDCFSWSPLIIDVHSNSSEGNHV